MNFQNEHKIIRMVASEELSQVKELRQKKEKELEKILGKEEANLILASINSNLEASELPIPMNRIPDMDGTERRHIIIKIARNNFIINELSKKITELVQP